MAAQHGGWLPENCAERQQCSLGLSSEVLSLGAPLEGSMAGGHMVGRAASWPSASLWVAHLRGSGSPPQGDRRQVTVRRLRD